MYLSWCLERLGSFRQCVWDDYTQACCVIAHIHSCSLKWGLKIDCKLNGME